MMCTQYFGWNICFKECEIGFQLVNMYTIQCSPKGLTNGYFILGLFVMNILGGSI